MRTLFLSVPILLLTVTASAQDADRAVDPFTGVEMTASDGGRAVQGGTEPLADDADPLNQMVRAETTDGLVVALTIDGAAVRLDAATPARVPLSIAKARRDTGGDSVIVVGYAGGAEVARTEIPDQVLNASEGSGLVRNTRRQVVVPLATSRPIDEIEVTAPATSARARLDVSGAWQPYCDREGRSAWCVKRR